MENASRALLIAAGILVGVLIITVGVALFSSFGGTSKNIIDQIDANKLSEYNNQFLKYYGEGVEVTAHDVITITNIARNYNNQNDIIGETKNPDYIQIQVYINKDKEFSNKNFETLTEEDYNNFIKKYMQTTDKNGNLITKQFEVIDIKTNKQTGKVIYVEIAEKN